MVVSQAVSKRLLRIASRTSRGYRNVKGKRLKGNWRRLKCADKNCPGTSKRKRGRVVITRAHNHEPRPEYGIIDRFEASLLRRSVNCWAAPRKIYVDTITEQPDALEHCPLGNWKKKISQWQKNDMVRPELTTFREFHENISLRPTLKVFDGGTLEVSLILLVNHGEIGLMGDHRLLRPLLQHSVELRIDITDELKPTDLDLDTTVAFSVIYEKAVLTFLWAFLPNKEADTFTRLITVVEERYLRGFMITRITTTLDNALYNALDRSFPGVPLQITFREHAKEMVSAANRLEIDLQPEIVKTTIAKLTSVSMSQNIPQYVTDLASILDADLRRRLADLFDYYRQSWVNGVTPEICGFHQKPESFMEPSPSVWIHLQRSLIKTNQEIWDWARILIRHHEQTHKDLRRLLAGQTFTVTPTLKEVINLSSLREAWSAVDNFEGYNSQEFLASASLLVKPMIATMIFQAAGSFREIQLIRGPNHGENLDAIVLGDRPDEQILLRQMAVDEIRRNLGRRRRGSVELDDTWSLPGSDQDMNTDDEIDIAAAMAEALEDPDSDDGSIIMDDQLMEEEDAEQPMRGEVQRDELADEGVGHLVARLDVFEQDQRNDNEAARIENEEQEGDAEQPMRGEVQRDELADEGVGRLEARLVFEQDQRNDNEAARIENENQQIGREVQRDIPLPVLDEPVHAAAPILVGHVENENPRWDTECPICRDQQIRCVTVPCGHLICSECISQIRAHSIENHFPFRCPFCNSRITQVTTMFMQLVG